MATAVRAQLPVRLLHGESERAVSETPSKQRKQLIYQVFFKSMYMYIQLYNILAGTFAVFVVDLEQSFLPDS